MRQYQDKDGNVHTVEITLLTRKHLRERHGVDVAACAYDAGELDKLLRHVQDADSLFAILATIEGVSVESLLAAADGDTEEAAGTAFLESLIDFFRQSSPLKRPLQALVDRVRQHQRTTGEVAETALMDLVRSVDIGKAVSGSAPATSGSPDCAQSQELEPTAAA